MREENRELRSEARRQIRAVEDFLRKWDPIGVIPDLVESGVPPDEYDSYAPYVVGLLQKGATRTELLAHLRYCRTGAMGLSPDDAGDGFVADQIFEWWQRERSRP